MCYSNALIISRALSTFRSLSLPKSLCDHLAPRLFFFRIINARGILRRNVKNRAKPPRPNRARGSKPSPSCETEAVAMRY